MIDAVAPFKTPIGGIKGGQGLWHYDQLVLPKLTVLPGVWAKGESSSSSSRCSSSTSHGKRSHDAGGSASGKRSHGSGHVVGRNASGKREREPIMNPSAELQRTRRQSNNNCNLSCWLDASLSIWESINRCLLYADQVSLQSMTPPILTLPANKRLRLTREAPIEYDLATPLRAWWQVRMGQLAAAEQPAENLAAVRS